ncbi:MAG: AzlD domain-containing protein [Chloroflexi bacterium]|nr:AzlD domain-containing protein [Chloroflexota bacterium]
MSPLYIWSLFIAIGVGTFLLRLSFIYLFGKYTMPDGLRRGLQYVPSAVLAALVFPAITYQAGVLDLSLHNARLLAGLGGALVAWRTKNVLLTIIVGMALLWLLQMR